MVFKICDAGGTYKRVRPRQVFPSLLNNVFVEKKPYEVVHLIRGFFFVTPHTCCCVCGFYHRNIIIIIIIIIGSGGGGVVVVILYSLY